MPYALPAAHVLGLTLVLLSAAPTALAAEGWSVVPAAGGTAGGRPSVYAEGAPGTVLQDAVSVLNPGARPLTVRLRGADADNTADGGFTVRERPHGRGRVDRLRRTRGRPQDRGAGAVRTGAGAHPCRRAVHHRRPGRGGSR
ncbi:hypothetical protein [Streptomyces sp. LN245]|uniref:hypothetical protein n=1 Tax=Streptomyces sp. LN245 TaxID=3112975 RepID=UPI003713A8D1